MKGTVHDLILVAIIAAVTIALRAIPFLIFPEGRAGSQAGDQAEQCTPRRGDRDAGDLLRARH